MKSKSLKKYILAIAVGIVILLLFEWMKLSPSFIEAYYSRGFYPVFSYLPKTLFGWIPFSVGDLFYALVFIVLGWQVVTLFTRLLKRRWHSALLRFLQFIVVLLSVYIYFYISWGLNYYRVSLPEQLALQTDDVKRADYIDVLDRYITTLNSLRSQLDTNAMDMERAKMELDAIMQSNEQELPMLSRTQVHVKHPLSSSLASYFTVTGYLNPFTQEVQVNAIVPKTALPFTIVHELSHQMGIGFEDECNFIAFLVLHEHPNVWYRYAAYYETVQYLLRPLYNKEDKALYKSYVDRLSADVRKDYERERLFWQHYRGPVDQVMGAFYGEYLRHNNQPEGIARYSLMSRLVVAWEKKAKH